jgi:hypothetical protein
MYQPTPTPSSQPLVCPSCAACETTKSAPSSRTKLQVHAALPSFAKPLLVAHGSKDPHLHHTATRPLEKQHRAQAASCRFAARSVHAPAEVLLLRRVFFAASRGHTHRERRTVSFAGAARRVQRFIFTQARCDLVEAQPSPFRRLRTSAVHVAVAESAAHGCVALTVACIASANPVIAIRSRHPRVLHLIAAVGPACPAVVDIVEKIRAVAYKHMSYQQLCHRAT